MLVRQFVPIALAALVAACATTPDDRVRGVAQFENDARLGEEVNRICFQSTIDNFSDATRDTVVLDAGVSRQYLVEVFGVCPDLKHAQSIGIASRTSCLTSSDALLVSDSAFGLNDGTGIGPRRCTIRSIYEWDEDAAVEETDETAEPSES